LFLYDRTNIEAPYINSGTAKNGETFKIYSPDRLDESLTLIGRDSSGSYNLDGYDRVSLCEEEVTANPDFLTHERIQQDVVYNRTPVVRETTFNSKMFSKHNEVSQG